MRLLSKFMSFIKTIYFNFKVFPIKKAIKLPILISNGVKVKEVYKNSIIINANLSRFMIKLGFGGSDAIIQKSNSVIIVRKNAKLIFNGRANFAPGFVIGCVGILEIGDGFTANKNMFLSCTGNVKIGNDVMLGWDVKIFDAKGHKIVYNEIDVNNEDLTNITIGNHVWLCSFSSLLNHSVVNDNSIVGWGSVVSKQFSESNVIISGNPATVKKNIKNWER